ncbi:unnamed protein product [Durusdinium trenchii]|uniref:Uncharacterized protein n=1 Tax=Durusdinium trenchii TaxID=1381693 RepID=A0ABP0K4B1_9DINO
MVAISRCCHVCIEQPRSSLMPKFPFFVKLALKLRKLFAIEWMHQNFWMGTYGSATSKPSTLFGTAPWIPKVYRKMTSEKLRKLKRKLKFRKFQMVKHYVDKRGEMKVQGGRDMTKSSQYPKRYGQKVQSEHAMHMAACDNSLQTKIHSFAKVPIVQVQPRQDAALFDMAQLEPLREFLLAEVREGRFRPKSSVGL